MAVPTVLPLTCQEQDKGPWPESGHLTKTATVIVVSHLCFQFICHNCQEKLQATEGLFLSSLDDKFHFFHKTHIINASKTSLLKKKKKNTSLYLTPLVFLQVLQLPLWGKSPE